MAPSRLYPYEANGRTEASSSSSTLSKQEIPAAHLKLLQNETKSSLESEYSTAPLFTEPVRRHVVDATSNSNHAVFSQYGLLGGDVASGKLDDLTSDSSLDPRIFYNTAAPSSVFICGSQGSGKSHTLSCLLENCLVRSMANELPRPLTGIVFHRDTFISENSGSPCEAAYLSSKAGVQVRVLCAPTNIGNIKRIYSKLPNVSVEELRINESDLNTSRMIDLMALNSDHGMPLYMSVVNRILRDMRIEQQRTNSPFNYGMFKRAIEAESLTLAQLSPLHQRLDTLESFMVQRHAMAYQFAGCGKKGETAKKGKSVKAGSALGNGWEPKPNYLTIVDLSCPCITAEIACSLFGVCLSLFLEQPSNVGRVIALDEAHKYMNDSTECQALTNTLLHTIRMQRHLGARVIISTQEPTISTKLLDLCSLTIVHRFTSPEWLDALKKHLAGASTHVSSDEDKKGLLMKQGLHGVRPVSLKGEDYISALFSQIVSLRTGEALIFSPSAIIGVEVAEPSIKTAAESDTESSFSMQFGMKEGNMGVPCLECPSPNILDSPLDEFNDSESSGSDVSSSDDDSASMDTSDDAYGEGSLDNYGEEEEGGMDASNGIPIKLGSGVLKVRIRNRVTRDGGKSIMAK